TCEEWELGSTLSLWSAARGVVMVLGAFFDEADRDDAEQPLVVSGYVFKRTAYTAFARAWKRMLKVGGPRPTSCFHATDLYARKNEYEGWSVEERAAVLQTAVEAIRAHMMCGVAVLINQR